MRSVQSGLTHLHLPALRTPLFTHTEWLLSRVYHDNPEDFGQGIHITPAHHPISRDLVLLLFFPALSIRF
jgi:hypothetical protein